MDYANLAQLSNPGASPYQVPGMVMPDASGVQRYNFLNNMQQSALQGGSQSAAMDLQKQTMDMGVRSAQQPGLLTEAETYNQAAVAKQKLLPSQIELDKETLQQKRDIIKAAAEKGLYDGVEPEAVAYSRAKTDAEKEAVLASVARSKKTVAGFVLGSDVADNYKHTIQLLQTGGSWFQNQPQYAVKRDVAETAGAAKVIASQNTAAATVEAARIRAAGQAAVANIHATMQKDLVEGKPLNPAQQAVQVLLQNAGVDVKKPLPPETLASVYDSLNNMLQGGLLSKATADALTAQGISGLPINVPKPAPLPNSPNKAAPAAAPKNEKVVEIASDAEWEKLAPGTRFKSPDGKIRIK